MLNQLIESKNNAQENTRKGSFILTTLGVLVAVLLSGWTYSLFAKSYGMGAGEFDLSSVVTPVPVIDQTPPPKPETPKLQREQTTSNNERPMVMEKVARMEDSLNKPPKIEESRRLNSVPLTTREANNYAIGPTNTGRSSNSDNKNTVGEGINSSNPKTNDDEIEVPKVVVKTSQKVVEAPKSPKPIMSLGVVNGKATYLAKPPYPPTAKAVGASGAVNVQVTIDESGNVVSASVVSGHPLLRAAAEKAARQSKFSPTLLSSQPVKVTGVIVYQFIR